MALTKTIEDAAKLWHERIGRFIGSADWQSSLAIAYPCRKGNGAPIMMRLGGCKASVLMMDANEAILVDKLNLARLPGLDHPECTFKYGEHIKDVTNLSKMQVNWALDEDRVFPLLLLRPGNKSSMACLALSYTPDQIVVCIPTGNYHFDANLVREARDYILKFELQKSWRKAADLRQQIGLGEHLTMPEYQRNKLLEAHAALLEHFPLDVWLPAPGTGDHQALGEALAEKPGLDIDSMPTARESYLKTVGVENVA